MDWTRACIAHLESVHGMACIAHSPLECKTSNEMGWGWACIGQLDTVQRKACIAHLPLQCKKKQCDGLDKDIAH